MIRNRAKTIVNSPQTGCPSDIGSQPSDRFSLSSLQPLIPCAMLCWENLPVVTPAGQEPVDVLRNFVCVLLHGRR